ncbi:MAG: hypothetical protein ACOVNR_05440, partial [Chitinophagaceae bacterium]
MKNLVTGLGIIIIFNLMSCKNNSQVAQSNNDTIAYFSLKGFFDKEKSFLDSMPYYIYQIKTVNNSQRDSADYAKASLDSILLVLSSLDIEKNDWKSSFTETSFDDLSTQSITLHYETADVAIPVKSIDVLFDEKKMKVKRIFIKTLEQQQGIVINRHYSWKTGKSCLITETYEKTSIKPEQTVTYFINWNDNSLR